MAIGQRSACAGRFTAQQTAEFRALLQSKRSEVLEDLGAFSEEARDSHVGEGLRRMFTDPADAASDRSHLELTLGLLDGGHRLLVEIEAALARLEAGTYGVCELTGKPIPLARLRAIPWARCRIEAALSNEATRAAAPASNP